MGKSLFVFARKSPVIYRVFSTFAVIILMTASLFTLFDSSASAIGQLTVRSLSLSTGVSGATAVQYKFTFTVQATSTVQSMKIRFCTTPVGTCNGVAGTTVPDATSAAWVSQNSWQGAVNFATGAGSNDCTASSTIICATRSSATNQTATARDITFGTITNPSTANTSFYARITTYSDAAYTAGNIQDTGTVAAAVVQSLQVAANVAEILQFCIGNTSVTDDSTSPGVDCSAISGTSVNIGTLDPSIVNISPVSTNGGNSTNGIAMLRTNAANGATVSYRAIPASTGSNHLGTLRLSGATCSASSGLGTGSGGTPPAASGPYTDGCIDAAGTTQNVFGAGVEQFGMTISGVNCQSTTSYVCAYSSGTNNLQQQTNYIGGTNSTTFGASAGKGFAWDESGSTQIIASSAASTIKQVDDEALILNFAATPSITTPFGSYTVQADFIAVPTY